jgi:hypothetical protein
MSTNPSLQQPQIEFIQNFLGPQQLQRMLIYFSKQKPTESHAQYGFTDIIVRLASDPMCIIFGQHGVYLFSNYLLVYPYNELDDAQVSYITRFLRMHVQDITGPEADASSVPSMKLDVRVTKQMGGGYTVRPVQLNNIHLDMLDVLTALVRGVMCGTQKHNLKYRQHAINLQLQRVLTRIVVSRAQMQSVNLEIEMCMQQYADSHSRGDMEDVCAADTMVECI